MKIKAKSKDGVVKVRMLFKHNMDTGQAKDKKGNPIPAHYITDVMVNHNGEQVFNAFLGPAVSKNPFVSFQFKGGAGGKITAKWVDNKGESMTGEAVVS